MKKKVKKGTGGRNKARSTKRPLNLQEQLGALAKATLARLEAQDRRDWEIQKQFEHEPMVGEATWYPHGPKQ